MHRLVPGMPMTPVAPAKLWTRPTVSFSFTPYQRSGEIEIGSPALSLLRLIPTKACSMPRLAGMSGFSPDVAATPVAGASAGGAAGSSAMAMEAGSITASITVDLTVPPGEADRMKRWLAAGIQAVQPKVFGWRALGKN